MQLIMKDLAAIAAFHRSKLEELGDPEHNWQAWQNLIVRFPAQWGELVRQFRVHESFLDAASIAHPPVQTEAPVAEVLFECPTCHKRFLTQRAMWSHRRAQHKVASQAKDYVPESGQCPMCFTTFSTRLRCIAHLSDKRKRGARIPCWELLSLRGAPLLPPAEASRLDALDTAARTAAQRLGRTQPLTKGLPKKQAAAPLPAPVPPRACKRRAEACTALPRKRLHVKTCCQALSLKRGRDEPPDARADPALPRPYRRLRQKTSPA